MSMVLDLTEIAASWRVCLQPVLGGGVGRSQTMKVRRVFWEKGCKFSQEPRETCEFAETFPGMPFVDLIIS